MVEPVIADSARKHGLRNEAILHAFTNAIGSEDMDDGLTMLVGRTKPDGCSRSA